MKMLRLSPVTVWLFALWLFAAPSHAESSCYQKSELVLFQEAVQVVSAEQDFGRGCWLLRLRLQGKTTPQGHAMFCDHNACDPRPEFTEGIYWLDKSPRTRNVASVSPVDSRSCSDVTLCIVPQRISDTVWLDFVAIFEEHYFVPPETFRPRWRKGLLGFSSFDGRSHCQDDGPESDIVFGSICIMN